MWYHPKHCLQHFIKIILHIYKLYTQAILYILWGVGHDIECRPKNSVFSVGGKLQGASLFMTIFRHVCNSL